MHAEDTLEVTLLPLLSTVRQCEGGREIPKDNEGVLLIDDG